MATEGLFAIATAIKGTVESRSFYRVLVKIVDDIPELTSKTPIDEIELAVLKWIEDKTGFKSMSASIEFPIKESMIHSVPVSEVAKLIHKVLLKKAIENAPRVRLIRGE